MTKTTNITEYTEDDVKIMTINNSDGLSGTMYIYDSEEAKFTLSNGEETHEESMHPSDIVVNFLNNFFEF